MKNTFTLFILFFSFLAFSQDLVLSETQVNLDPEEYIDYGSIDLTNNGQTTVELAVTLEKVCLEEADDAAMQICIGDICFTPVSVTTTWGVTDDPDLVLITLEPGETNTTLKFDPFFETADYGSEWNVVFFEIDNVDNNVSLNVKVGGECTPVSTNNLIRLEESAFPNPASDYINIPFTEITNAKSCLVYNSQGVLLEELKLTNSQGMLLLDVSNYSKGMYFYQISTEEGNTNAKSFVRF